MIADEFMSSKKQYITVFHFREYPLSLVCTFLFTWGILHVHTFFIINLVEGLVLKVPNFWTSFTEF